MKLSEHFELSGGWLFRHRGGLPLLVLAGAPFALAGFQFPDGAHGTQETWMRLCLAVSLLGVVLRVITIGHVPARTSGRNTARQIADQINTTGMYSVVRHPLYLGNLFIWLGAALSTRSAWFVCLVALVFWLYHERIIFAEEAFLERTHGNGFRFWAARTPAFLPNFRLWQPPALPFSFRNALRREYLGAFGVFSTFVVLEHAVDWYGRGHFELEPDWLWSWVASLVVFLTIRLLVKRTRLFHVSGR